MREGKICRNSLLFTTVGIHMVTSSFPVYAAHYPKRGGDDGWVLRGKRREEKEEKV